MLGLDSKDAKGRALTVLGLLAAIGFVLLIAMQVVSADLGTFQQGQCVIIKVDVNASYAGQWNISSMTYPINSSFEIINKEMTRSTPSIFNYSFCNTTILGNYVYDLYDNLGNTITNGFTINGSGQEVSDQQVNLIWIGIGVFLAMAIFFFVLSFIFKHPGTRIFFMALSTLTMILLIGVFSANANVYLAEFPNIVQIYNNYYVVMIILAGAAVAGLILWFIYFAVTTFNKVRGRVPEEDD